MKKVKITILKTTLQEDLAKEYGVEGLSTCPLMNISMFLHLPMALTTSGIMKTGLKPQALP